MKYLDRYIHQHCIDRLKFNSDQDSDIVVVIPAYNEDINLLEETLYSLDFAYKNSPVAVTVLLLINYKSPDSDSLKSFSENTYQYFEKNTFSFDFRVFKEEMHGKHAGVGLARRMLMDAALMHFTERDKNGLIVNLDADTHVDFNYFKSIWLAFQKHTHWDAASIAFSHRLDADEGIRQAIVNYESHLRYFVNMQRLIDLPYAFQTVGSAMAVRAFAYAKMGGMPKKQAGEDFYFLHKYSKIFSLGEINGTIVYPSCRKSDRVPFGTGKAVGKSIDEAIEIVTYNPIPFELLQQWMFDLFEDGNSPKSAINRHSVFENYLKEIDFDGNWQAIQKHTASESSRRKRFFAWFDAFALMKYMHYMRENGFPDVKVSFALQYLFEKMRLSFTGDAITDLETLRYCDIRANYRSNVKQL